MNAVATADVLKEFRDKRVQILTVDNPSAEAINEAARVLKKMLDGVGYMDASVLGMRLEGTDVVQFVVSEGIQYSIASIALVRNQHLTPAELAARLREYLVDYSGETGTRYD